MNLLNETFIIKIKSSRWPRPDEFSFTKTEKGWFIKHIYASAECDKMGRPLLKKIFDVEKIKYKEETGKLLKACWDISSKANCPREHIEQLFKFISDSI